MQAITSKIYKDELYLITEIIEKHPKIRDVIYSGITKIPFTCTEKNFFLQFDSRYFQDFLELIMHDKINEFLQKQNKSDKTSHTPEDLNEMLGSTGITELIKEKLNHLIQSKNIDQKEIDDLIKLIHGRNELAQVELQFINESYQDYLKTNIKIQQIQLT